MTEDKNEDKKQEILKWLKEFKRLSTSRIAGMIGRNIEYAAIYLEELRKEGLIKKEIETNSCYWSISAK